MPLFGAHMSIAGGYYLALEAAERLGMESCQLFTKSNQQWAAKNIAQEEAQRFREVHQQSGLKRLFSHASYLLNLASENIALHHKSLNALVIELERAEKLGLDGLVLHPGAHGDDGEEAGLERVVAAIDAAQEYCAGYRVRLLLETTAGMGRSLGWRFEQLGKILRSVRKPDRIGICVDTCHIFAAGYSLSPAAAYRKMLRCLDKEVGLEKIELFHVNDSLKPLGSRVDRHAHIGKGCIGLDGIRNLVRDKRFRHLPMILETPKIGPGGEEMDAINLKVLRSLTSR